MALSEEIVGEVGISMDRIEDFELISESRVHQGYTPGTDLVHRTRTRKHRTLRG